MKFILVLCAVILFHCSSQESPTGPSLDKFLSVLKDVQKEVTSIRGLEFKRDVHFGILSRSEFAAYNDSYTSSDMQLYAVELKQLGFIPDTVSNFGNLVESFNDEFAAAFYVPGTDSVYVIDAGTYYEHIFRYYAAHELTHALQEQHFNAFSRYIYPSQMMSFYNSDFYLAQLCVAEGDASLTGDIYFYYTYTPYTKQEILEMYAEERDMFFLTLKETKVPRYLEIKSMAPYILGSEFIGSRQNAHGWSGINNLYHTNRISSTAEVITSNSVALETFDFSTIVPILLENTRSIRFADDDTYGPIMLMVLLCDYVDEQQCRNAFGWQGDRIYYVISDENPFGSFVWALNFQNGECAQALFTAFDQFLTNRKISGGSPVREHASEGMITYSYQGISTTLSIVEKSIVWVENVPQPERIIAQLQPEILAKARTRDQDYSSFPKADKWKMLRTLIHKRDYSAIHR